MLSATNDTLCVKLAGAELQKEELGLTTTQALAKQASAEVRGLARCVMLSMRLHAYGRASVA